MAKQSSSSREKLSSASASSTSFHSPSSTVNAVNSVNAVVEDDDEMAGLSHAASPHGTPPLETPTSMYACSAANNTNNMTTCVDSLDSCSYSTTSMMGLQHNPSAFITKEHLQMNMGSSNSPSIHNKPIFVNSLLVEGLIDLEQQRKNECSLCMCGDAGEMTSATLIPLKLDPTPIRTAPPTPKFNPQPSQTFDSLNSLSTSIFQLKNYTTASSNNNNQSSIVFTDESSPFLNDRKCLSDTSKYSSRIIDWNTSDHANKFEHYSSTPLGTMIDTKIDPMNDAKKNDTTIETQSGPIKIMPPLAPTSKISDSGCNDSETNYCHSCDRKLPVISFKCRCGFYYCNKHRHAELHNCPYDYKAEKKKYLRKNVTTVVADKVRKI